MSARTVEAYLGWVRRFVRFHRGVHPAAVGERGVEAFLSHLASAERVSASTQNQALAALLFLYAVVLGAPLGKLAVVHARRPVRVPVVMTREEVGVLLGTMSGTPRLMASLLYGSGLRLHECVGLRVKDVDVGGRQIWVRRGKSMKDRATPLPLGLIDGLQVHLAAVREQHDADVHRGCGYVELPEALALKYPSAGRQWPWQWVFPATRTYLHLETGERRRHHLHETASTGRAHGGADSGPDQTGELSHVPSFIRYSFAGGGL